MQEIKKKQTQKSQLSRHKKVFARG